MAAGSGGATAVSDDAGRNYTPVGGDIAGSFQFGLRLGPAPGVALALGARGQLARTTDNGVTWKAINVATSADMQDTSFSTTDDGYALDQRGGLFRTVNGGASWQPIDPGTTAPPRAVITTGNVVLLAGPTGVRRASGGGQFDLVSAASARRAKVTKFDRAGGAIFAYGATAIVRTTNGGRAWTAVKGPSRKRGKKTVPLALRDVEMTSGSAGYALDTSGRVWRTANGGRRWTELPGDRHGQRARARVRLGLRGLPHARRLPGRQRRRLRPADRRQRQALASAADRQRPVPGHRGRHQPDRGSRVRAHLDARRRAAACSAACSRRRPAVTRARPRR